jgi:imidazoleglycerol phosphate synthase glutamine amidotransferase subunit HisH
VNAAFRRGNVFATQFHPEKSGASGLALLANFVRIAACDPAATPA